MQSAEIISIHLFLNGSISAVVKGPDGVKADIEIPMGILEGKTMDERYAIIKARAERYMSCLPQEPAKPQEDGFKTLGDILAPDPYVGDAPVKYLANHITGEIEQE